MQLYLDEETRNIVHAVYRDLYYVDYLEWRYLKYLEKYDSRVKEKSPMRHIRTERFRNTVDNLYESLLELNQIISDRSRQ